MDGLASFSYVCCLRGFLIKMCTKTKAIRIGGRKIRVDSCMANLIILLNKKGIRTVGSCCGHMIYSPSIIAVDMRIRGAMEIFSGIYIPRDKRFYKQDKGGFYYIPEVVNEHN